VRRLASSQRGLAVREQLLAAGVTRGAIAHRIAVAALVVVHRGVYRIGHDAPAPFVAEMAAALYFRGDAVLSHRSAAAIWGLLPSAPGEVQLTIVGRDSRSRPGIRLSRAETLDRRDFRWRDGLPVTSPARTLIDLASCSDEAEFERALAQARVLRLVDDRHLHEAMARGPHRRGVAGLRSVLAAQRGPALTRSEAERRFLALIDAAQLPWPEVNVSLCGHEVDCLWPGATVVAEVDGHAFHGDRAAFERDRRRDQVLVAAGYDVIRVTWRQLTEEPLAVAVRLGQALARDR
jgi:hypothetical protein